MIIKFLELFNYLKCMKCECPWLLCSYPLAPSVTCRKPSRFLQAASMHSYSKVELIGRSSAEGQKQQVSHLAVWLHVARTNNTWIHFFFKSSGMKSTARKTKSIILEAWENFYSTGILFLCDVKPYSTLLQSQSEYLVIRLILSHNQLITICLWTTST